MTASASIDPFSHVLGKSRGSICVVTAWQEMNSSQRDIIREHIRKEMLSQFADGYANPENKVLNDIWVPIREKLRPEFVKRKSDSPHAWEYIDSRKFKTALTDMLEAMPEFVTAMAIAVDKQAANQYEQRPDCGDLPSITYMGPWMFDALDGRKLCMQCAVDQTKEQFLKSSRWEGAILPEKGDTIICNTGYYSGTSDPSPDRTLVTIKKESLKRKRIYWQGVDKNGNYWYGNGVRGGTTCMTRYKSNPVT